MMFSEFLANENMPEGYKFSGTIDKRALKQNLTALAKDHPHLYPEVVHNLKRTGDMLATYEGLSVGLDDVTPDYQVRNKIVDEAERQLKKTTNRDERVAILLDAQQKGLEHVQKNQGSLGRQVMSGSRGKPGQLLKTVFSPIVAKGKDDIPEDYMIRNSYAEGLTPGEFWTTAGESRRELALTQLATAIPGDTSKQLNATLNASSITMKDCGTKNGVEYSTTDNQIVDRYEAGSNRLIDASYARDLRRSKKHVIVRSPMTCLESPGVCQMCFGHDAHGRMPQLGTNIGLRAAQSLSEPLTQMILSAKHGGITARAAKPELRGTMGFRQLLDIPKVFKDEAVLANVGGQVSQITASPQGGYDIYVGGEKHYAPPGRKVVVRLNDTVGKGQILTDGIPNPRHVVALKGLGAGRKYVASTLYDIYQGSGVDIDKRHIELLTKQDLNHVKVLNADHEGEFLRGDVVPYNRVREHLAKTGTNTILTERALGRKLSDEYLHYTAGTSIDHEMLAELRRNGIDKVLTSDQPLETQPLMRPLEQIPLLSKDWVSRLAHRRLKDTIREGASQGWSSDTRGAAPYPALLYGKGDGR